MSSITVIIPFWNAGKWLARALKSVLAQDGPEFDVVAVDDGSTDDGPEIARSFGNKISVLTAPNRGACAARNRGLALARSDYVLFLDADDYLEQGSLDSWCRTAAKNSADVVFGPFAYEQDGRLTAGSQPTLPFEAESILIQWLGGWFTPPCAVLWRRTFVDSIGGWSATLSRNQDGELAMRALLKRPRIAVAEKGCGIYVQHDSASRVSRRSGSAVLNEQLGMLRHLWNEARAHGFAHTQDSFAQRFYGLAYEAFATGNGEVGHLALMQARALGLNGHVGSLRHRALSSLLGLDRKMKLTSFIRNARTPRCR